MLIDFQRLETVLKPLLLQIWIALRARHQRKSFGNDIDVGPKPCGANANFANLANFTNYFGSPAKSCVCLKGMSPIGGSWLVGPASIGNTMQEPQRGSQLGDNKSADECVEDELHCPQAFAGMVKSATFTASHPFRVLT